MAFHDINSTIKRSSDFKCWVALKASWSGERVEQEYGVASRIWVGDMLSGATWAVLRNTE